jgi:hypothetical protein
MADTQAKDSEDQTLDRLVSELSLDERHNFLEKLKEQSTLSFEPLYEADAADEKGENFEARYTRLSWYYRLYYFILSLFKGKTAVKVFEDSRMNRLGQAINAETPGLYDYRRNLLLFDFYQQLSKLKEAARFFFTALDAGVNRDKGAFYAFLGSLEMAGIHNQLQNETDPKTLVERYPAVSEAELRQAALRVMDEIFITISDTQRSAMYYNARSLNCLKELSAFLFDRVIFAFGFKTGGQSCPVTVVRDSLINLNNILYSLKEPPVLPLLESLFIFLLQDRKGEPGFDMDREMQTLLSRAENAISTIRDFNKRIPLTKILRCAAHDMNLVPRQISGGEDWFQVYHEYWRRKVESTVAGYMRDKRYRDIVDSFKSFLKGQDMKFLDNAASESNRGGMPVPEAFALSFLLTFYTVVFISDINPVLRPLLMNGEFLRKENRAEFTGAYNDVINTGADIKKLEANIAPDGDYGKRYIQAKQEISPLPIKRRKMQNVLDEISLEAAGIIIRAHDGITMLINILNGILKQDSSRGGRFESIANFEKFAGSSPEIFTTGIVETIKKLQQALQILNAINDMGNIL